MKVKTKKFYAWIALMTILFSALIAPAQAFAASMNNVKVGDWISTWSLKAFGGQHWTDAGYYKKLVDGKDAFCIEHGVDLEMSGSGYDPSVYESKLKDRLALIAYYGYQNNPSNVNYAVTQSMIWEELGDTLLTTNIPNYQSLRKSILNKVNSFNDKPSFNEQTITLNAGDSITLTDTKKRLSEFNVQTANTAGLQVSKSSNTLKLTATKDSKASGTLAYAIAKAANVGQSFVYTKGQQQKIVHFKLAQAGEFRLNIKVNHNGHIRAKKIDSDTNTALPNTKLKFEYDGKAQEVITGKDGYAALNDIKAGTKVKITEVTSPNGYVNAGELKEVTIEPNKTIEVVLGNKKQLGNVELTKIGREFGTTMYNQYYSLNGAVYGIYTEAGKKFGTITTDETGKGHLNGLALGKYYALEEKAPVGYLLNTEKLPFELKYAGQTAKVSTASIKGVDQEQLGNVTLIKEDAETDDKAQGSASLDGAVYELHRVSDDKVISEVTIEDGQGTVENIPLDDYYFLETKAPHGYLLDDQKHEFKLEYAGQDKELAITSLTVKEQVITGHFDLVKLESDQSAVSKLEELDPKQKRQNAMKDIEFTITSKTTNEVVQTGKTDTNGYLKFSDLPFDTYMITETNTPDGYEGVEPFQIAITEDGQTLHYQVENKKPVVPETPKKPEQPVTPQKPTIPEKPVSPKETPAVEKHISKGMLPQTGESKNILLTIVGVIILLNAAVLIGGYHYQKRHKQ